MIDFPGMARFNVCCAQIVSYFTILSLIFIEPLLVYPQS